jgi:toxin ParE1/3/4
MGRSGGPDKIQVEGVNRRLIVRSDAEADITEAALWYEGRGPGLGLEMVREVQLAAGRAVGTPLHFPLMRQRPEVRRVLTRRFPYREFFIVRDDAVVVFAVMHAARHDRHWRTRL